MKKIILVPILLLLISSCTLPFGGSKNDGSFSALYDASVHSSMTSLDELGTLMGINRHESIVGSIRTAMNVPGILSGSLSSEYSGLIDGRNGESTFRKLQLFFTSLVSSGSLSADEIGLISHGTESYVSYKNLVDTGIITDDIRKILKKYENSWLSIIEKSQMDTMSSEELMGYNIGKNIFKKSLADIEKYATDYQIWKETADLGMSGSLHVWSVELDRAHIVGLMKQLSLDLAGTGMTDAYTKTLEKNLTTLSFSGKIGYNPTNPKISLLDGSLSVSGALVAQIMLVKNEDTGSIRISNIEDKTDIVFNYGKTETKHMFDGSIRKGDIEMGKMNGYIQKKDGKFQELSLEASAQGMTVSLKHTMNGNVFNGKLSAVVGSLEWSGTIVNEVLTGLKIDGTAPFGSILVNLTQSGSDNMIRGPITVKAGEETLFSANLALEVAREKFAMILDVIAEGMPAHFELDVSAKTTPSDKQVSIPTSTHSLQELIKEIDALSPASEMESGEFNIPANTDISSENVGVSQ